MIVVRGLGHSPVAAGHADSASRVSAPHLTVQLGRLGRVQAQRLHSQIQLLATRRVRSCFAKRRSLVDGGGRKMVERALIHLLLRGGVVGVVVVAAVAVVVVERNCITLKLTI